MTSSLRFRLLLLSLMSIAAALLSTALVLNVLFQNYFEDRIEHELRTHLYMITGQVGLDEQGEIAVAPISDPRFSQPLSGYFWQIQVGDAAAQLSPSLWAAPLVLDRPPPAGQVQYETVNTSEETAVSTASWRVLLGAAENPQDVIVTVGMDRSDIDMSTAGFLKSSAIWLAIMGAFLMVGGWLQVRLGLRPLEKVRSEVTRIMTSPKSRLSQDYPREVQPLASEVNTLLEANEAALTKARTHSGNLAHGLKTPLTVLQSTAHQLRETGQAQIASEVEVELENMRHIVERELASVRNNSTTRRFSPVRPSALRLVEVLKQQPNAAHINWKLDLSEDVLAPFDIHDLTELLGNLMDNAMKWTRDQIHVSTGHERDHDMLCVEDNGPGISPDRRGLVLERGEQLVVDPEGAGLGLAIVSDMAKNAGCTLSLNTSETGGLSVKLIWSNFTSSS